MSLCEKLISTKILTAFACILLWNSVDGDAFAQSADTSATVPKTDSVSTESLKSKVQYSAFDSIRFDIPGEKVYLYGKAKVRYEDIELDAHFIEVDWTKRSLQAAGGVDSTGKDTGLPVFKQGSDSFTASTVAYNFDTKKGRITEVNTRQGDGFILGETIKRMDEKNYFIRNGAYTTCDLPHPHFSISANKLKVIQDNKVVTGPAWLVIEDVSTPLMIPFGYFPTRKGRASGILFPSYGESGRLGFFFKDAGYYFGIGDVVDFAITGDIYTLGSWGAKLNSNYALRYRFNGNVSISYSEIKTSEKELPDYNLFKDFFIRWSHRQDSKARPGSNFSANVNAGSSGYYQNNISSANNYLTNTFQSSVAWSKNWAGKPYSLSASLTHSQNTITRDVSMSLPNTNFSVNRVYPFKRRSAIGPERWYEKIGVSYQNNFQNNIQTKDTLLFKEDDQFRYGMSHTIPISTSAKLFKYFTLAPSFTYNERWYPETIRKSFNSDLNAVVTDTVKAFRAARDFQMAASLNTRLYGLVQMKRGKIAAIRHMVSPTVSLGYRPDFSSSSYKSYQQYIGPDGQEVSYSIFQNGIFGGPPSGKYGVVGFSIDNNLEMKVRQQTDSTENLKKIKIFESLSASMVYNLAADSLNWSNLNISGRTTLFEKVNLSFSGSFDPYVTDTSGIRINRSEWKENKRIGRLNNANASVNFSLVGGNKKERTSNKGTQEELNQINRNIQDYVDYSIPFNLSVGYSINYSKSGIQEAVLNQTLNMNGDVSVTPKWKMTFNTGWDFVENDLSYTSLGIFRDLHCWEMRFNWVPFGFQQNYFFQINVKSSILQDLKLTKKNDIYDR
ncbi:MAG: putative LPS assembly protein LptD [Bacteroidota bacterium]